MNDPDGTKALDVDGAIGELSLFHETSSYYAQGVEVSSAVLPEGWRDRVVPVTDASARPARAHCLEPHDLVVSKLVAHRQKDYAFAWALIQAGLVDVNTLLVRAETLPSTHGIARAAVVDWLHAAGRRAQRKPIPPG